MYNNNELDDITKEVYDVYSKRKGVNFFEYNKILEEKKEKIMLQNEIVQEASNNAKSAVNEVNQSFKNDPKKLSIIRKIFETD
jgi:hypothetical protein